MWHPTLAIDPECSCKASFQPAHGLPHHPIAVFLPVAARFRFKTLVLDYKAKHGSVPTYLKSHMTPLHHTAFKLLAWLGWTHQPSWKTRIKTLLCPGGGMNFPWHTWIRVCAICCKCKYKCKYRGLAAQVMTSVTPCPSVCLAKGCWAKLKYRELAKISFQICQHSAWSQRKVRNRESSNAPEGCTMEQDCRGGWLKFV